MGSKRIRFQSLTRLPFFSIESGVQKIIVATFCNNVSNVQQCTYNFVEKIAKFCMCKNTM
jgi:hypothetical protein